MPLCKIIKKFREIPYLCVFLILCCLPDTAFAAQIIRSIPASLQSNWTVCLHFESTATQCQQSALPESWQRFEDNVKWVSYTKQLIIHQNLEDELLAISIAHIDESDEVWFNGKKIGATGKLPPSFETGYRQPRAYILPSSLIKYDQYNQLEIKTFSSRHLSPMRYAAPELGLFEHLQHKHQELDYLYLGIIISFILLILFQIFYLITVRPNNEIIFLLVFFFSIASIAFLRSQMPTHLGFDSNLDLKLESFLYAFANIGLAMFLYNFFELTIKKIDKILLFLLGISGVASLIWYDPLLSRIGMELNQGIVCIACLWLFNRIVIPAIFKQRVYSTLILVSLLVYWLVIVLDTLMDAGWIRFSQFMFAPWLLPLAANLFGLLLALTLTHKYWQFFKGATYDHLTGTMLRPAFFQRLSEEMQRSDRFNERLLVAVIDIRQVRKLTANYGQSAANQMLSVVSIALTKVLRPFDLLCRFNDDEFCIAATVGSTEDAEACMDRIYNELTRIQHRVDKETEVLLDAKIGGVLYLPEHHLSVSQLLQDANYALAKCKNETNLSYYFLEKSRRNI